MLKNPDKRYIDITVGPRKKSEARQLAWTPEKRALQSIRSKQNWAGAVGKQIVATQKMRKHPWRNTFDIVNWRTPSPTVRSWEALKKIV